MYLGQIGPAMSGVGYTFQTQYTWILGDFNAAQAPDAMYRLPFRDGTAFRIGQSPGGPITTHNTAESQYAVDIPMPEGTPILAAREGKVIYTEANQTYGVQSPDMLGKANEVRIQHIDGTIGSYAHLSHGGVYVYPGQRVNAGQQIGLAGSTGYSSGPHLHFSVQTIRRNGDKLESVSVPFNFYVGNPPLTFAPQYGMLAKADYNTPGTLPGQEPTIQVASTQPETRSPNASGNNIELVMELSVPPAIGTFMQKFKAWQWFAGLVCLVLLYVWLDKRKDARRRANFRLIREPTLRSRPAEEPIFHGLSARDKLIVALNGDRQKADQLIEQEHQNVPSLTADEAAQGVRERLGLNRH